MSSFKLTFDDILNLNCKITCNGKYPHEWYKSSTVSTDISEWFVDNMSVVKYEHDAEKYGEWDDTHVTVFKIGDRYLGVRGNSLIYPHAISTFHMFEMESYVEINYRIKPSL